MKYSLKIMQGGAEPYEIKGDAVAVWRVITVFNKLNQPNIKMELTGNVEQFESECKTNERKDVLFALMEVNTCPNCGARLSEKDSLIVQALEMTGLDFHKCYVDEHFIVCDEDAYLVSDDPIPLIQCGGCRWAIKYETYKVT